jgi:soluble calcium-activated nucleotidase 1
VIEHAGDKEGGEGGRGAEFSALEMWQGELLTMDDRTGGVFAISVSGENDAAAYATAADATADATAASSVGSQITWAAAKKISPIGSEPVVLLRGDGTKKGKGLKCEWAAVKDGKMFVGSTGKERTNDDGTIAHMGEMWVKIVDADWNIQHVDWTENYNVLRTVARCQWGDDPHKGAGYMIHESARWSDVHQRWFFFPRKLSRETYDGDSDEKKCCNLMLSCDADFSADSVLVQPLLSFVELRGECVMSA